MSELQDAMRVGAALPKLHAKELAALVEVLGKLTISDMVTLRLVLTEPEHGYRRGMSLRQSIMHERGEMVRVAEWHVIDDRCEHKRYSVGNVHKARHGEIGDQTWLEAWIA